MSNRSPSTEVDLDAWLAGSDAAGVRLGSALRQPETAKAVLGRLLLEEALRVELRSRRGPRLLRLAVSSMLAAGLIAALVMAGWSSLNAVPVVELAGDGAQAWRAGKPVGGPLQVGDEVRGSGARIALSDGTSIALDGPSTVAIAALNRSALEFVLADGAVAVDAAYQPGGRELRISTTAATVRVVGTSFTVTRWPGGSTVAVTSGRVVVEPADGAPQRFLGPGDSWHSGLPRPLHRLAEPVTFDGIGTWRDLGALPAIPDGVTFQVQARAEAQARGTRLVGTGNGPWQLNISLVQWDGNLVLQVKQPGSPGDAVAESQLEARDVVRPGSWAVYEATITADGEARIMRDGEVVATGRLVAPVHLPRIHAWVGRSFYDDPYWKGEIRDLRIYPRALTLTESRDALAGFASP